MFEGHSTDYQTAENFQKMVEDGICILKVGATLTFALREGLFALYHIDDLISENPAGFMSNLESEMLKDPTKWENHYFGNEKELFIKRKCSFSDRARYYLPIDIIETNIDKLFANLSNKPIDLMLLSQFMPNQFKKVNEDKLLNDPKELLKDHIKNFLEPYDKELKI